MNKKIIISIIALLSAMSISAFEYKDSLSMIKLIIPEGYEQTADGKDNDALRATFRGPDSDILQVLFFKIDNIDKGKAKKANDDVFFNMEGLEEIERTKKIDGCDQAVTYYSADSKLYWKFYRNIHSNGIAYIKAVREDNDFSSADDIVSSYDRTWAIWGKVFKGIILIVIGIAVILLRNAIKLKDSNIYREEVDTSNTSFSFTASEGVGRGLFEGLRGVQDYKVHYAFFMIFGLPLIPTGSYLVKQTDFKSENENTNTSYSCLGKVKKWNALEIIRIYLITIGAAVIVTGGIIILSQVF